ncbi:MAG TPA: dTDP-4-dehydrorhamnose reductase [Candidatus Dormibacteraeota bacterium]|jgi:dTDP-4-dehydrorhamnose reductase|nr:dTDP-4-dehydrorhamnose reductase [Candidatus Dormibacteraeota bacterium]
MSFMILGAGGQVGSSLCALLPDAVTYTRQELSLLDWVGLRDALTTHRPAVVYNAAAYNAVDRAESEPEAAMAVNGVGPGRLAALCSEVGAHLVHFSTNYVFDGESADSYLEDDQPNPINAYARSKLAGEELVLASQPRALVIRTAGVFAVGGSAVKGGSLPERMLARARSGEIVRLVDDQTVNPTYAPDLAAAAVKFQAAGRTGLLHVVNEGCTSYYEFVRDVFVRAGLDPGLVQPISSAAFSAPAARPPHACMDSKLVPLLRPWREALPDFLTLLPVHTI